MKYNKCSQYNLIPISNIITTAVLGPPFHTMFKAQCCGEEDEVAGRVMVGWGGDRHVKHAGNSPCTA